MEAQQVLAGRSSARRERRLTTQETNEALGAARAGKNAETDLRHTDTCRRPSRAIRMSAAMRDLEAAADRV